MSVGRRSFRLLSTAGTEREHATALTDAYPLVRRPHPDVGDPGRRAAQGIQLPAAKAARSRLGAMACASSFREEQVRTGHAVNAGQAGGATVVLGSMMASISVILLAGKPLSLACCMIASSLSAR